MPYAFFAWIENLPLVLRFTESLFAYPLVQGVHVLALAFAVGLLALADLRLAGLLLPRHSARALLSALRPWFIGGFSVLLVTGVLLFLPQATSLYDHPLFLVKLGLIALAGVNAVWFELNFRRTSVGSAAVWRYLSPRAAGLVSLGLWTTILVLGRLLAYF
ncbi:MAG TPA: hypothetical protein VGE69_15440 [Pseudomonadales bacterium]